ncbi:MAG: glycine/betaine ABC transporter substrate-binding protein [Spirochaetaceae bacterium]|nr:MAG: glycine/betaine ABC transporter substrate-binding protein [Spirochaetaceae bacterium]
MRTYKQLSIMAVLLLLAAGPLFAAGSAEVTREGPTITVASKAWTEQLILGNMLLEMLRAEGYAVEDRTGLGESDVIRPALHAGQVDMYWEYTGTTLLTLMEHEPVGDPDEAFELVKRWDERNNDVTWLDYAPANNTYTIMMPEEDAQALGIESISDLAAHIRSNPAAISFGTNDEFYERQDGIRGLEELYGFEFDPDQVRFMTTGLTYGALREGQVDAAVGFGTDGRIPAFGFINLEDDKQYFPVYNPAPLVRMEIVQAYPELPELVGRISALLDGETLAELNRRVDIDEQEPEDVAVAFLREHGLID